MKRYVDNLSISLYVSTHILQAIPLMEHLPEYKALEDEDGRRAAFARFVKRQKVHVIFTPKSLISYRTPRNGNEKQRLKTVRQRQAGNARSLPANIVMVTETVKEKEKKTEAIKSAIAIEIESETAEKKTANRTANVTRSETEGGTTTETVAGQDITAMTTMTLGVGRQETMGGEIESARRTLIRTKTATRIGLRNMVIIATTKTKGSGTETAVATETRSIVESGSTRLRREKIGSGALRYIGMSLERNENHTRTGYRMRGLRR